MKNVSIDLKGVDMTPEIGAFLDALIKEIRPIESKPAQIFITPYVDEESGQNDPQKRVVSIGANYLSLTPLLSRQTYEGITVQNVSVVRWSDKKAFTLLTVKLP